MDQEEKEKKERKRIYFSFCFFPSDQHKVKLTTQSRAENSCFFSRYDNPLLKIDCCFVFLGISSFLCFPGTEGWCQRKLLKKRNAHMCCLGSRERKFDFRQLFYFGPRVLRVNLFCVASCWNIPLSLGCFNLKIYICPQASNTNEGFRFFINKKRLLASLKAVMKDN